MSDIKMTALQSITASQSPTGKALSRGAMFEVTEALAHCLERAGRAKRVSEEKSEKPKGK